MPPSNATRAGPAAAGSGSQDNRLGATIDFGDSAVAIVSQATLAAWCLVLGAVADMRDALHDRIDRGDIDDLSLEPDCRNWCNLARALADFLTVRRSA